MPEIEHEGFSKIFSRCGRGVAGDVVIGIVLPLKIPGVRCAEGVTEFFGTDEPAVGVSDRVRILVAQDIAQRGVATAEEVGEAGPRNPRDMNFTAAAIPVPAIGDAEGNEIDVHAVNEVVLEAEAVEFATDIASGRAQVGKSDKVHRGIVVVTGGWRKQARSIRSMKEYRGAGILFGVNEPSTGLQCLVGRRCRLTQQKNRAQERVALQMSHPFALGWRPCMRTHLRLRSGPLFWLRENRSFTVTLS